VDSLRFKSRVELINHLDSLHAHNWCDIIPQLRKLKFHDAYHLLMAYRCLLLAIGSLCHSKYRRFFSSHHAIVFW
jgi:hypothetical protein